LNSVLLLVYIT